VARSAPFSGRALCSGESICTVRRLHGFSYGKIGAFWKIHTNSSPNRLPSVSPRVPGDCEV
jgi:hypothetical protein